jgi:hypothetical protein
MAWTSIPPAFLSVTISTGLPWNITFVVVWLTVAAPRRTVQANAAALRRRLNMGAL